MIDPAAVARAGIMRCATVFATRPEHSFPYYIGTDCTADIVDRLAKFEADLLVVVVDEHVAALHGNMLDVLRARLRAMVIPVPEGEEAKQLVILSKVVDQAIAAEASQRSVVVAFGGGSTGNLAGLAASLLFRGVRLVHLPTTTIGAFDSALSMKQAVNSQSGKNQIGTYHRPTAALLDTCWFDTLPIEIARGGSCEAVKNCLAIHPNVIENLGRLVSEPGSGGRWSRLFDLSLAAKMAVMADDPHERIGGLALEYGHTIGHAIEFVSAFGLEPVTHGDAVALGVIAAARVAEELGLLTVDDVREHERLITLVGAPTRIPRTCDIERVVAAVRHDNKRGLTVCGDDEVAMVLLEGLGRPFRPVGIELPLATVPIGLVKSVLADLASGIC